ncbi:MAG: Hpt domain-containing protein, partial [Magnetococcales bacterium]|nr:Hpt domain-containing protein [Magnetococcales bacterium]
RQFLKLLPERIAAIRQAVEQQQVEILARVAHGLHGGAAQLGALSLARCASSMEEIARRGQLREVVEWLPRLDEEADHFREALQLEQRLFGFRQDLGDEPFGRFLTMARASLSAMLERIAVEKAAGMHRRLAETARELSGLAGSYGLVGLERSAIGLEESVVRTQAMPDAVFLRKFEEVAERARRMLQEYPAG